MVLFQKKLLILSKISKPNLMLIFGYTIIILVFTCLFIRLNISSYDNGYKKGYINGQEQILDSLYFVNQSLFSISFDLQNINFTLSRSFRIIEDHSDNRTSFSKQYVYCFNFFNYSESSKLTFYLYGDVNYLLRYSVLSNSYIIPFKFIHYKNYILSDSMIDNFTVSEGFELSIFNTIVIN